MDYLELALGIAIVRAAEAQKTNLVAGQVTEYFGLSIIGSSTGR